MNNNKGYIVFNGLLIIFGTALIFGANLYSGFDGFMGVDPSLLKPREFLRSSTLIAQLVILIPGFGSKVWIKLSLQVLTFILFINVHDLMYHSIASNGRNFNKETFNISIFLGIISLFLLVLLYLPTKKSKKLP
jgi:hypothetical protein